MLCNALSKSYLSFNSQKTFAKKDINKNETILTIVFVEFIIVERHYHFYENKMSEFYAVKWILYGGEVKLSEKKLKKKNTHSHTQREAKSIIMKTGKDTF